MGTRNKPRQDGNTCFRNRGIVKRTVNGNMATLTWRIRYILLLRLFSTRPLKANKTRLIPTQKCQEYTTCFIKICDYRHDQFYWTDHKYGEFRKEHSSNSSIFCKTYLPEDKFHMLQLLVTGRLALHIDFSTYIETAGLLTHTLNKSISCIYINKQNNVHVGHL